MCEFAELLPHLPGWTEEDARASWQDLEVGFMRPHIEHFSTAPEAPDDSDPDDWCHAENFRPGFYARLTAPGYLDRTDWAGPFQSVAEAMAHLILTFGE